MKRHEAESSIGKVCVVNGSGDLMMDRAQGKYIGEKVTIKQVTKGGMVLCFGSDGKGVLLPPRNLDVTQAK